MLRKTLIRLTIATALTFGVASLANASDTPGLYLGGQLGWGDTHDSFSGLPGSSTVQNTINAFGNVNWNNGYTAQTKSNTTGIAGRLFVGYQFNPNWAAEFGFAKFRDAAFKGSYAGSYSGNYPVNVTYSYKGVVKTHAFDLVGKGILPLQSGFSLFGKLGMAYVQQTSTLDSYFGTTGQPPVSTNNPTQHENRFMPVGGVGISYDITPNVPIDVSWMHYQKVGGSIPNADLVSLGVAYKFNM